MTPAFNAMHYNCLYSFCRRPWIVDHQDKKITSFQPAWLIRCSTPH